MTSTASNPWLPTGRHQLHIGSSLRRALKARKGGPHENGKQKHDKEFYSFRYNFVPESVDTTKNGTIDVQPKEEGHGSNVSVVRPSTQTGYGVSYVGTENPAREFECILIWDAAANAYTLEKVESTLALTHDHKRVLLPRHVGSPAPPPQTAPRMSASSSTSSTQAPRQPVPAREEEEESEGEILESKPKPKPRPIATSRTKPPVPAPTPVPAPSQAPATSQPISRPSHVLPTKPVPAPVPSKAKGKAPAASGPSSAPPSKPPTKGDRKREAPANLDEETLEIRRPIQPPAKKPKLATEKKAHQQQQQQPPPKPKPVALSFPNSSSLVSFPPPLPSGPTSSASTSSLATVPAAATIPEPTPVVLSDSEDEWDPIDPVPHIVMEEIEPETLPPPVQHTVAAFPPPAEDNEGEEIDMAAFEAELNGELADPVHDEDEDEDFLVGAVSPVAERQPQSLAQYAGNIDFFGGDGDDDEYSSSDDSDDD